MMINLAELKHVVNKMVPILLKPLVRLSGTIKYHTECDTLPETNSSHLKMRDWKTSFLLGWPIFRGYVSFREGNSVDVPLQTEPQK